MHNNENKNIIPNQNLTDSSDDQNRRELVSKLGKFAIYAAPFTVLAINSQAATASGPRKGKP